MLRAYLCVHGEGIPQVETEHIVYSRTVYAFTRETQNKCGTTWSGGEVQADPR